MTRTCLFFAAVILLLETPAAGLGQPPAHFMFVQKAPNGDLQRFVFEVVDPTEIAEFRRIIENRTIPTRHVSGVIDQHRAPYNPQWSFHLIPGTIGVFEMQIEVCDANVTYVEAHLDEVGGSFLPRSFWCPWSSELDSEVP
jgi:hypothetical protein